MNQKVIFRSVFVAAVAFGIATVAVRAPKEVASPGKAAVPVDKTGRALAAYRLQETGLAGGMEYRGVGYTSRLSETGFTFGSPDVRIEFGAPRIAQGGRLLECAAPSFSRDAFGRGRLDRGIVQEAYLYENRRVEQTFTFPSQVGTGDLTLRIPASSTLSGPVVAHSPTERGLKDLRFLKGGLAFCDGVGLPQLAYHSAVVIDAKGRELALAPKYENREIVLDVPARFMADAAYPVVVDPWLELDFSASVGGISKTGTVSDRPSLVLAAGGNPWLAWADNRTGNYEIYVTYWNGFDFVDLGGGTLAGGISHTTKGIGAIGSVNPHITLDSAGLPYVCWQDDDEGRVGVYFRRWNGVALSWEQLDHSGETGGLSATFAGPALNPQVLAIESYVNNTKIPRFEQVPLIVWEEAGTIHALWHYSGDDQTIPGTPGWYDIGPINNSLIGSAGSPSISLDGFGRPVVAWHDTQSGEFDIYVRRLEDTGFPNGGPFFGLALVGFPAKSTLSFEFNGVAWTGVNASDASGGISNAVTNRFSQYPSVATDGTNITVAWQETLPAGASGTNSEIFLLRNTGGGWAPVGGSTTTGALPAPGVGVGGGISQTQGNSTHPTVDVSANQVIVVAWVDDTGGNTDIYARQFRTGISAAWEQVGDQGSAFPQLAGDAISQTGGVSQTVNQSLTPTLKLDRFGSPTIAWMDGNAGQFDVFLKVFSPNGPGVMTGTTFTTNLTQTDSVALTPIAKGSSTVQTAINLSASVYTETLLSPLGTSLQLQVEVVPVGSPFTGLPTPALTSLPTAPGGTATVFVTGLPNGNYVWAARTIDQFGRFSPWVEFGGPTSFVVNTFGGVGGGGGGGGGGGSGPPPSNSGGPSKGSCGLTGLEGILALLLVRRLRRK